MKLYSLGKWVPKVGKERIYRRVAKEGRGRGEDSLPARLKQVQFSPNRKHAFF